MYLSRLVLNRGKRDVQRDLGSLYELHRTLMRGFPDAEAGGAGRVLFRLEIGGDDENEAAVLVQSEHNPKWDALLSGRYLLSVAVKQVTYRANGSVKPVPDTVNIQVGECFRFRVVANPTVKRKVEGKKNGRRDACVTEEQQLAWLVRKGESGGFRLVQSANDSETGRPEVLVVPLGRQLSLRGRSESQLCHFGVRFDGILAVTDPGQFIRVLESGLGSAKAFGYGLVSIARP